MNKRLYLLGFLVLATVFGISQYTKDINPEVFPEDLKVTSSVKKYTENQVLVEREEVSNSISDGTTKNNVPSLTSSEIKTLHENFPDKSRVIEDLKSNPHTPSETLMTFAKKLGPLMEKAFKNEKDADILIQELYECANDESVAYAGRAMCVTNTERLAEVHPKIKNKAKDLRDGVSPEVQKILDTNDAFIKK